MSSKERRLEDDAIPPQSPSTDDRSGQASPKRKEKSSKQAHKGSRPRPVSSVRHSSRKREPEGVLSASDHTPSPPPLSGEEHPSLKGPATASASTTMPPSEVSAEAGKSSALSGSTTAGETPRGTSGTATAVASPPVPEATSPEQGQLLSPQQSRQQRRAHSPSPPPDSRGVERTPAKHASTEDTHTAEQPASMSKTLSPLSLLETSDRGAKATAPLSTGEVLIPKSSPSRSEPARALKAAAAKTNQDYACGLFGFHPNFLQKYRTPRCALTVLCLVSFTRSFSMNGVMMVVLPTLERRYQLMSYESGMILSSNDVASCLTMLPVAFLATKRNKPRFIGYGVATMGLGNLVVAMVHFLSPSYQLGAAGTDTCPMANVESSCTMSGSIRNFRFMMMAGQLLSGLGATPINTVTIAYLDENVQKRKSSLYIGACL
ncbi:hypothetical protein HPB49_019232 [Dermacentor silvarum]|uniref:Uncharacterized protein n=1 Tax=Dermacentor silvarum TaxID=543639 RepID=A0ACB8CYX5_DERSI|nr:hypothetical protein HPB49_019232 [Dermacentor silvarum]